MLKVASIRYLHCHEAPLPDVNLTLTTMPIFSTAVATHLPTIVGLLIVCTLAAPNANAQVAARPARVINYSAENFDRLCFRNMVATAARAKADRMLLAKTAMTGSSVQLSPEQKAKLLLAGEIDIQRFFAAFDELKSRWKFGSIPQDVFSAQFPKMRTAALPLMERYQKGLHGEGSLYHKAKVAILTPSDFDTTQAFTLKRKQKLYRNLVRATVASLDSRLPLTIEQREAVIKTIMENTEPMDPQDYNEPMLFATLPKLKEVESKLQPIFSEQEWLVVKQFIALAELRKR